MEKVYNGKELCCGCQACMNICPKDAITMMADEEGFLYPVIEQETCISCGLCKKVCPFDKELEKKHKTKTQVYAAKHKNETVRYKSTSGGAFTAISDWILQNHGSIYGVGYDEDFNVVHQKVQTSQQREQFCGAKYVQSDMNDTYVSIKQDLENDMYVLFTGTPCQCAGVYQYVQMKKLPIQKLVLCDIVCHGVPSPKLWAEHLTFVKNKLGNDIQEFKFRDKSCGWRNANISVTYQGNRKKINTPLIRAYSNLYFGGYITRPSCHVCPYTKTERITDFTIGDFWGIEKCMPEFDDNKGVSLILIHTSKGEDIFHAVENNLECRKSNTKECLQPQLIHPTKIIENREAFWEEYKRSGYQYIVKKYAYGGFKNTVKFYIVKALRKICRKQS